MGDSEFIIIDNNHWFMLEDEFGREVSGVRVSLTDRCNFDCVYCHNEGLGDTRGPMDPQDDEMSTDDVVRFLRSCLAIRHWKGEIHRW